MFSLTMPQIIKFNLSKALVQQITYPNSNLNLMFNDEAVKFFVLVSVCLIITITTVHCQHVYINRKLCKKQPEEKKKTIKNY